MDDKLMDDKLDKYIGEVSLSKESDAYLKKLSQVKKALQDVKLLKKSSMQTMKSQKNEKRREFHKGKHESYDVVLRIFKELGIMK